MRADLAVNVVECAEYDAGAAHDRERGVWELERGVERVQAVEMGDYLLGFF